jgi:hypothetical protein
MTQYFVYNITFLASVVFLSVAVEGLKHLVMFRQFSSLLVQRRPIGKAEEVYLARQVGVSK